MLTYNYMMFSDDVDERKIAAHWVRKTGYMLQQALDYRLEGNNSDKFMDIYYKDLISDSNKELGRIYSMDGGLTPRLVERFKQHELEHPHRKHGVHQYSLGDFGLTESDIDLHTSHYQNFIKDHYGRQ